VRAAPVKEKGHMQPITTHRATAQRERAAQRQRQTDDDTIIQHHRTRTEAEDTQNGQVMPRSAIRYQPQPLVSQKQYVIPLTNGRVMRVTERELADLPEEYQEAAQVVQPMEEDEPLTRRTSGL